MPNAIPYPWEPGDVVVIETPEQTRVEFRLASFGTRILAALVDRLIILGLMVLLLGVAILGMLIAGVAGPAGGDVALVLVGVLIGVNFLLTTLYFVWTEVRGEGQTPGKRLLKIRTVLGTGQGITIGAAFLRNLARLIDDIPLVWIVPTLWPGCQRLGDRLAGTYVVKDAPPPDYRADRRVRWPAASYRELEEKQFADLLASDGARRGLYPADLNLLEYLMVRIQDAAPGRRPKLLRIMAKRYLRRLGLEEAQARVDDDPRRFLQELALALRDRFQGEAY